MSLSSTYREIKHLRSRGDCAAALAMLRAQPPASDEDGFEAVVCLFVCGDLQSALNVCTTRTWQKRWSRDITSALVERLARANTGRALELAGAAASAPEAPADAAAIHLLLLKEAGKIEEALEFVDSRLQNPPVGETFLLTVMAEIAVAGRDWRQAYRAASAVLCADPDDYRALMAMSVANSEVGNVHEALGNARRAALANPGTPATAFQLMRCYNRTGDHYAALGAFETLRGTDHAPEIHLELGAAYAGLGDPARAIESYRAALAPGGDRIAALRSLLELHATADDPTPARELAERYPAEIERSVDCLAMLGLSALNAGDLERAARCFDRSRALSDENGDALRDLQWPASDAFVRAQFEQLELLERRGRLPASARDALSLLRRYAALAAQGQTTFAPPDPEGEALKHALSTMHHLPQGLGVAQVLGENDYRGIEDRYAKERLVVIDNFLSQEALAALREYCEEATIWKVNYARGYLGALLAQGFAPPVLLELAGALRRAMPTVVGPHPLLQAWAFKYDQRMQGINMHADFAKVNVNFWITPDSACEDATTGGMVVYDVPVPESWTFADYNNNAEKLAAYLRVHDARPTRVPYRENRCVLFDSSLIHVTDEMHFRPGYENRRVNVTLLYGNVRPAE